jgi:uncharacterized protein (TIGR02453 family)
MGKQQIFDFLRDLDKNNSKDWMDENRGRYQAARKCWLEEIGLILDRLARHDAMFETIEPKDTVMRITNNRMFHPDKPVYRDNFACSPVKDMSRPAFCIHVSPNGSFIGGGLHRPEKQYLDRLRSAIDYDDERLKAIIGAREFQQLFGGFSPDDQMLKSYPRGYSKDHRHVDLLRRKNFTALRPFTEEVFVSDQFATFAEETFLALRPLNEYLEQAV